MKTHLVEELIEKLDVDKHSRRICELVGHNVEEGFRTQNIVGWTCSAPFGFQRRDS